MNIMGKLLHTYIHTYIHTEVVCLFENVIWNRKRHRNPFGRVSVPFFAFFKRFGCREGGRIYD